MTTTANSTDDDATADEMTADVSAEGADDSQDADRDWKAEFEAQQKVNRDLERKNKRTFEQVRKDLEAKYRDQLAEARKAQADDAADRQPDLEAIKKQVRDEVTTESLREKALDKIETKAARLFADPEDARTFLAGRVDDFIDDGKVDVAAISDALDDLLKQRPYLAVAQGEAKRFQGSGDIGAKTTPAGVAQLTQADLDRMNAAKDYAGIAKARADGRFDTLLGITRT